MNKCHPPTGFARAQLRSFKYINWGESKSWCWTVVNLNVWIFGRKLLAVRYRGKQLKPKVVKTSRCWWKESKERQQSRFKLVCGRYWTRFRPIILHDFKLVSIIFAAFDGVLDLFVVIRTSFRERPLIVRLSSSCKVLLQVHHRRAGPQSQGCRFGGPGFHQSFFHQAKGTRWHGWMFSKMFFGGTIDSCTLFFLYAEISEMFSSATGPPHSIWPKMVVMKWFSMPSGLKEGSTVTVAEWDVCTPLCWGGKYPQSIPQIEWKWNMLHGGPGRSGWPNKITIHNLILQHTTANQSWSVEAIFPPKFWTVQKHLHQGASHDPSVRVSCIIGVSATYILQRRKWHDCSFTCKWSAWSLNCFSWCYIWHVPKCPLEKQPPRLSQNKGTQLPHFCISS